ncbi:MAG: transposase [Bacteroidetes bacterium]|nr:transposase [Bacteroidota bacterium]
MLGDIAEKKRKSRKQSILFPQGLDEIIEENNDVRFIDLFAESIDIPSFSFNMKESKEERTAYHPKDLLKHFIYGYLNSIRSSRALEKQCHINLEVHWLLKELAPDKNTIANFRRDNEKAIRKVFQYTVHIAKHFELIGGKLIAGGSTKPWAQNS